MLFYSSQRANRSVQLKFIFLFLILENKKKKIRGGEKDYDNISKDAREVINSVFRDGFGFVPNPESNIRDYEKWYILEGKVREYKAVIKHFKMRIILEIEEQSEDTNLADIFRDVRTRRKPFKEVVVMFKNKFKEKTFIDRIFHYLLIEVNKDYKTKDFKILEEEAITTFFYEVPDYRRKGAFIQKICLPTIPKTIIRLSRPSTITSKMSGFMRTEVINILYDTCLYHKREEKKDEIEEKHFREMKTNLGKILFDTEMSIANGEITTSVHILSILMGIGAIAGILAIIAFLPMFLCEQNTILYKSLIGLLLFVFASWIFFHILRK